MEVSKGCSASNSTRTNLKPRWKHRLFRIWKVGKVIGPALLSVVAVGVSFATYVDQHRAETSTAAAIRGHSAEEVSYWVQPTQTLRRSKLIIENRSSGPISDAWAVFNTHSSTAELPTLVIELPDIPPCTIAELSSKEEVNAITMSGETRVGTSPVAPPNSFLTFVDANGEPWTRYGNGVLEMHWTPPSGNSGTIYGRSRFSRADGCS